MAISPEQCQVMISFHDSSAGREAEQLANLLNQNGIATFCTRLHWPQHIGEWRQNAVVKAVNHCKIYIPLMTNACQKSVECQDETRIARNLQVKDKLVVLPVRFEDFDDEYDRNHHFTVLQFGQVCKWFKNKIIQAGWRVCYHGEPIEIFSCPVFMDANSDHKKQPIVDQDDEASLSGSTVECFQEHRGLRLLNSRNLDHLFTCHGCNKRRSLYEEELVICDHCKSVYCIDCDARWINYQWAKY